MRITRYGHMAFLSDVTIIVLEQVRWPDGKFQCRISWSLVGRVSEVAVPHIFVGTRRGELQRLARLFRPPLAGVFSKGMGAYEPNLARAWDRPIGRPDET
jgi:hypothetical protein